MSNIQLAAIMAHVADGHGLDCADSQALIDHINRLEANQPYKSEDHYSEEYPGHKFVVILYTANGPLQLFRSEGLSYADALANVAPGNDVAKVEIIAV